MEFDRTGIILYVLKYHECVDFYENTLGLTKMFETEMLTCFGFGGAYLMVEKDDECSGGEEGTHLRARTCLRMNVPDVKLLADTLKAKNVAVDYREQPWGTIAKFYDPDGNLCAFKDTEKFEKQIQEYRTASQ